MSRYVLALTDIHEWKPQQNCIAAARAANCEVHPDSARTKLLIQWALLPEYPMLSWYKLPATLWVVSDWMQ